MLQTEKKPTFFSPLREEIDLYPAAPQVDGSPTWVLHDPVSNRFLQIGWLEFEILARWEFRDVARIVSAVNRETTLQIEPEDVAQVGQSLQGQQFLKPVSLAILKERMAVVQKRKGGVIKFLLHHYLFFRIPLFYPDSFLEQTLWLVRPFYSRGFILFTVFSALLGFFLILRQWDVFVHSSLALISWDSFIFYIFAVLVAKSIHEMGHAYACKLYGLHVPVIGMAFLVLCPFLYTDTGESWKLSSRRQRLVIVSAGMAAECSLAVFSTLAWTVLPIGSLRDACFFLATTSWVMTLAINISPFMRWDGYYLLSDLTGLKNLQPRSMELAKWWLRELIFDFGEPPPEQCISSTRRFMIIYAFAVWLYRLTVFLGIAFLVYHFFIKMIGIFLMIIELSWFIWLPIQKEIVVWYRKRTLMKWNRHTICSALVLGLLLLAFLLPWRGYILLPAVKKPDAFVELYPVVPGKIIAVAKQEGDRVAAEDVLYHIDSPSLNQEIAITEVEMEKAKVLLQRSAAADLLREQRSVILEQYTRAIQHYNGLQRRLAQQQIKAPFSGVLTYQDERVQEGLWVSKSTPLGMLIGEKNPRIYAYARAEELASLEGGETGLFYAEQSGIAPLPVSVHRIHRVNSETLTEPLLAENNGGAVRVKRGENGEYIPEESIFQVELEPENSQALLTNIQRGHVRIKARPESFALKLWRNIYSLLIRESGF